MSYLARGLLERLDFDFEKVEARKVHARLERGRLILPMHVRQALQRGEHPGITMWGREPCDVEIGLVYGVSPRQHLTVTERRRTGRGDHRLVYSISHRPRLLVAGPPKGDDARTEQERQRAWRPDDEHGYATSGLGDAGEAVDETSQRRQTQQAHDFKEQGEALQQARRERYELSQRLARAQEDAQQRGVDVSSSMRVIERQLVKIERRVYEGKAA